MPGGALAFGMRRTGLSFHLRSAFDAIRMHLRKRDPGLLTDGRQHALA
jgi:hypothetical protein